MKVITFLLFTSIAFGQTTLTFATDGDSITNGYQLTPSADSTSSCRITTTDSTCVDWGSKVMFMPYMAGRVAVHVNFAENGNILSTLQSHYTHDVHPRSPSVTGNPGILGIWIGANDQCASSAAAIESGLTTYWAGAKADGWKLAVFTILRRSACAAGQEAIRTSVNTWIKSNSALYDWVIDADSVMPDQTDSTLFQADQVHPTYAGQLAVATLANQVLMSTGVNQITATRIGMIDDYPVRGSYTFYGDTHQPGAWLPTGTFVYNGVSTTGALATNMNDGGRRWLADSRGCEGMAFINKIDSLNWATSTSIEWGPYSCQSSIQVSSSWPPAANGTCTLGNVTDCDWKSRTLFSVDGKQYLFLYRQDHGGYIAHDSTMIMSADGMNTWTNPAHLGVSTNVNGDAPAGPGDATYPASMLWPQSYPTPNPITHAMQIQMCQDGSMNCPTGAGVAGCDPALWVCFYIEDQSNGSPNHYLMRVGRTNLPRLRASDYLYFQGGDGTQDSAWTSSLSTIYNIPISGAIGNMVYLKDLGIYYWTGAREYMVHHQWAPHPWGPWTSLGGENFPWTQGSFPTPILATARLVSSNPAHVQISVAMTRYDHDSYALGGTTGYLLMELTSGNPVANNTYVVGDVAPSTSDTAPHFGDGKMDMLDLTQVLFAVNNVPGFRPAACSDRFDAMDLYPIDTGSTRGGDGVLDIRDLIRELLLVNNLDLDRPVRATRGGSCPSIAGTGATTRTPEFSLKLRTPSQARLVLRVPELSTDIEWQVPVYLEAGRDLTRIAVTFAVGDQRSQLRFVAAGTRPSLVQDNRMGVLALAWLEGVSVRAGERLLLGYVRGAAGTLANLQMYGVSASGLDDGQEVLLDVSIGEETEPVISRTSLGGQSSVTDEQRLKPLGDFPLRAF